MWDEAELIEWERNLDPYADANDGLRMDAADLDAMNEADAEFENGRWERENPVEAAAYSLQYALVDARELERFAAALTDELPF
jgi:hypothetical protein